MADSSWVLFGVYDSVYDTLLDMPDHLVLVQAEYGKHFVWHVVNATLMDFTLPNSIQPYETILVGEIRPALCSTKFSAKGNHYYGNLLNVRCFFLFSETDQILFIHLPYHSRA